MTFRALLLTIAMLLLTANLADAAPGEDRIRDELREIYERDEFKREKREPSALERGLQQIFRWFGSLHGSAPLVFWLLIVVIILLLVLLFSYLGVVIRRSVYVRRDSAEDSQHDARRRQLSAGLRAEADEHARTGDYTAAVRCLFLSLVYAFDESGRLHFEPSLTNREYLHGLLRRPEQETALRVFVDVLDDNWYGQHSTTAEQYQKCLALYEKLRKQ